MALAVGLLAASLAVSPGAALWAAPAALSLLLAAPVSHQLARTPARGGWLWRAMATPEDVRPPAIVSEAAALAERPVAADDTLLIRIAPGPRPVARRRRVRAAMERGAG
jgi:membrane glycosyltransferase